MSETLTVLLTCAGRRTSLLESFLQATRQRGGRVLAGDNNPLAPTLYLADKGVHLPRVLTAEYVPALFELVRQEKIGLIIPTIDTELAILSQHADDLAATGCKALVSSPKFIEITSDKWLFALECIQRGIAAPHSWLPKDADRVDLPERLFLKPRDGSASQHAHAVQRDKLAQLLPLVPNPIIQERLEGDEITIDALLDFDGRPLHYVPRRRIRTLGGESIEGITISHEDLHLWIIAVLEFASHSGARGPITLQAFLTSEGPILTEINARFGGGFPLTNAAGGRYPEWILRSLAGETLEPCFGNYKCGLYMTRYYVEHFVDELPWA